MTRLLNVWYLIRPSCHLFCFLLRSWVKRQTNSRTNAVLGLAAWPGGAVADPEDMTEGIADGHIVCREFAPFRITAWSQE